MSRAPDFSAYIRDTRLIVQILLATRGKWLTVFGPCEPDLAIRVANEVVSAGQDVNLVRITSEELAAGS